MLLSGSSPRREMGHGFVMGSPSLPLPQTARGSRGIWFDGVGLRASGKLPVLTRTGVRVKCWPGEGEIGETLGVVSCSIILMSTCLMVKDTGVHPPGSPVNAVVDTQIQAL